MSGKQRSRPWRRNLAGQLRLHSPRVRLPTRCTFFWADLSGSPRGRHSTIGRCAARDKPSERPLLSIESRMDYDQSGYLRIWLLGCESLSQFLSQPEFRSCLAVSDPLPECRDKAQRFSRHVTLFTDARELIDSGTCDAVAIATPVATHYALAAQGLHKRLHVLVEKPLCTHTDEGADTSLRSPNGRTGPCSSTMYSFSTMQSASLSGSQQLGRSGPSHIMTCCVSISVCSSRT